MKKIATIGLFSCVAMLAGCATPYSGGIIYNDYDRPMSVRDNATDCAKRGESSMVNILGYFAVGDASVSEAKKGAGITKVGSVDTNFTSLLGIFAKTTTIVCGE